MEEVATMEYAAPPARINKNRLIWFVFLLALANFIWAGQLIAIKFVENSLGPFTIAFLPFLFVTPLMIPLLFRKRSTAVVRPTATDWMRVTVAGVGGQVVCMGGMTWGAVVGSASNCAILYLLIPVITAVMASIMLHERVTMLRILCLGIGLVGVLFLSTEQLTTVSLDSKYLKGNLLMLIGCFGACFYNVYCKGLMEKFNELDLLIYSYITATPAGLIVVLIAERNFLSRLANLDTRGWLVMVFLALLVMGISMIMFFHVLKYLPVTVALASTYLTPVFGVVLAMLLLGDRLSLFRIVGSGIVLIATVLIMKYDVAPSS